MLRFNIGGIRYSGQNIKNFNTSYVAVQLEQPFLTQNQLFHFNTSYVAVQPGASRWINCPPSDFNTSYVAVQRKKLGFKGG